jgi:hypothetical protein
MESSESHDLVIPDFVESSLESFDIDELLQTAIPPCGIESHVYALGNSLASSTSPEDAADSHHSTYDTARSSTLSGEQGLSCLEHMLLTPLVLDAFVLRYVVTH